ncbi:MAG: hypothetical protein DRR08_00815 [Candidatus Parabeggiatoa sp. nov. 2]|nr:MAG: hypothetical protein B6247_09405 [Beggiatoa sp. 4572_84]RKZ64350.1 MAG: hypothetical protein DRR08_00815 [Gammaproteobacteria bacterium]HEC83675.1 hypothetical protein [Thioploca sp.]
MSINAFIDLYDYSENHLSINKEGVHIAATYQKTWNDGFGARGWKLDVSIGDPAIIASTRETGAKIPTSVLIHDMLDHLLSGFGISGHRSEAMALTQLSLRTGADIRPDYEQMVDEDIILGQVNGETLAEFLPPNLLNRLPETPQTDKQIITRLTEQLGINPLKECLVKRFYDLGEQGKTHALSSWKKTGLPEKRTEMGLALQKVLYSGDNAVEEKTCESAKGIFSIANTVCRLEIMETHHHKPIAQYLAQFA